MITLGCGIMALVSFPAAAADPSVIGLADPAAEGESPPASADAPVDDAAVQRPDPDHPAADVNPGPPSTDAAPASAPMPQLPASLSDEVIGVARAAAVEEAGRPDLVGEYLGAVAEDAVAVGTAFAAADRGYRGWYWSVTLALVEPGQQTISEVVLLPGDEALLAPPWVPWDQRIRAGDVGAGDLLPTTYGDVRLVPGYVDSDDPAVKEVEYEFGFGRPRVLSREGRDDAAQRWHDGPFGPDDAIAQAAPAHCTTCGFFTPLAGLLGMTLGACANEFSPADGRVVDAEYGCGAHSQTVINAPLISASTDTVVDELTLEVHRRPARSGAGDAIDDAPPPAVDLVLDDDLPVPATDDATDGDSDDEADDETYDDTGSAAGDVELESVTATVDDDPAAGSSGEQPAALTWAADQPDATP